MRSLVLWVSLGAIACSSAQTTTARPDTGPSDGGRPHDAQSRDAGDAVTHDAGDAKATAPRDGKTVEPPDATLEASADASMDGDASHMKAEGIVCLIEDEAVDPNASLDASDCWRNDAVAGVSLGTHWNVIQPNAPSAGDSGIDWSFFDTGVALARAHQKFIGIGVAAGVTTPDWVYGAGAPKVMAHVGGGDAETESEPWNHVYQEKFMALVAEMGRRYGADTVVAYVFMGGPGREFETYYLADVDDVAALDAAAPSSACTGVVGSPDAGVPTGVACDWAQGAQAFVDAYASAFPHTPVLLVMANPFGGITGTGDAGAKAAAADYANGQSALEQVVAYGVANHENFGVRSDGLLVHYDSKDYEATETLTLSPTRTVGFQMNNSAKGLAPPDASAAVLEETLDASLKQGIALGAHFIEVFAQDCNNPIQTQTLLDDGPPLVANANKN